jgi:hypothetical protein
LKLTPGEGVKQNMEEIRKSEELTLEELEEHTVELLPDREEMRVRIRQEILQVQQAAQAASAGGDAVAANVVSFG